MEIILESRIEPHPSTLYSPTQYHQGVPGFSSVDESALQAYDEQGFLVIHHAFCPDEVEAAKRELREMVYSDDPRCDCVYYEGSIRERLGDLNGCGRRASDSPTRRDLALGNRTNSLPDLPAEERAQYVRKFMGFTEQHPPLAALASKPELIRLVTALTGAPIRLFQEMAMIKPPRGREKPWHQDHAYFNLPIDTRIVGVWIALDRVTPENGCMHVLAGAHRDGPRIHFMRRDWQICDDETEGTPCTALPMEAGDAMFFDAKLPHGTPTNQTDEFRWAIQLHYVPTDAEQVAEEVRLAVFGSEGKNVSC